MPIRGSLHAVQEIFHNRSLSSRDKIVDMLEATARALRVGVITLYAREWRREYCALAPPGDYRLYHMVGVRDRPPMLGPFVTPGAQKKIKGGRDVCIWPDIRRPSLGGEPALPGPQEEPEGFAAREGVVALARYRLGTPPDPMGALFYSFRREDGADLTDEATRGQLEEVASYISALLRLLRQPSSEQVAELVRVNKHIAAVSAEIARMASEADRDAVLDSIVRGALEICRDTEAVVTIHTIQNGMVRVCRESQPGLLADEYRELPIDSPIGVVAWVGRTGSLVFLEDADNALEKWQSVFIPLKDGVTSEVAIPMYRPGSWDTSRLHDAPAKWEVMGVLNVETPARRRFKPEMTYYWWVFAQQAARTLDQTERVIAREKQIVRVATMVADVAGTPATGSMVGWITSVLNRMCEFACDMTHACAADAWIWDVARSAVENRGRCNIEFKEQSGPRRDGFTAWVLNSPEDSALMAFYENREGTWRVDTRKSKKLARIRDSNTYGLEPWPEEPGLAVPNPVSVSYGSQSEIAVPLTLHGQKRAVLFAKFDSSNPPTRDCIQMLFLLSDLAGVSLAAQEVAERRLMRGFAHDARRPLERIQDYAESIADFGGRQTEESQRIGAMAAKVLFFSEYADGLIDCYFTGSPAGCQVASFVAETGLRGLVADACEIIWEVAGSIENRVPEGLTVKGERRLLLPAFVNVLYNAADGALAAGTGNAVVTASKRRRPERIDVEIDNPRPAGVTAARLNEERTTGTGGVYFANTLFRRLLGQLDYSVEGDRVLTRITLPLAR